MSRFFAQLHVKVSNSNVRKLEVTWMQQLNLIFAVFTLALIRKTLILEESGYNAAVMGGGFMRIAWTGSFSWYRNETIFASSCLIGALPIPDT